MAAHPPSPRRRHRLRVLPQAGPRAAHRGDRGSVQTEKTGRSGGRTDIARPPAGGLEILGPEALRQLSLALEVAGLVAVGHAARNDLALPALLDLGTLAPGYYFLFNLMERQLVDGGRMTEAYMFTGRILPERQAFNLESQRLYVRDDQRGLDACLIFGVMDNQLVGRLIGKIGHLSNFTLKMIVDQAAKDVMNAIAFTTGRLYGIDLIGVTKESGDRGDGSIAFHYFDNSDEVIANRTPSVTVRELASLFITANGIPVRRCLSDLRMALTEHIDSPYYCYRALETIRGHLGAKHGESRGILLKGTSSSCLVSRLQSMRSER
jgi:hypothetical protein